MYRARVQSMAFKRTENWNFGEISITPRMLKVLSCIRGTTRLIDIEKEIPISFEELCNELYSLLSLKLIAFADHDSPKLISRKTMAEPKYFPPAHSGGVGVELR